MKKTLFAILITIISVQAFSQHGSAAYRTLADSLYAHHHYQIASEFYMKALKKSPHQGDVMLQLAKCHYKMNLMHDAEKWFKWAQKNHGAFSTKDYYEFAQVLIVLKKRHQADTLLEHVLKHDINNEGARKALADLRNVHQYYRDSAARTVEPLSVNTPGSEFAPVYYKNGLVFTSSRHEGLFKKKSHWDNSPFLNLFFSDKAGNQFTAPKLFEDDLNTKHHDGPAAFYGNYQKMIINRNQRVEVEGRENVFEWRPGLYDVLFNAAKSSWQVTPLPFNNPKYSFLHPSISEDGNTLYFASDIPGGYGGTDIYRVVRTNGTWGPLVNAGPSVNTPEDEAFPFFIGNKLYFASNGHGGLGGLDIFKCEQSAGSFNQPVNMGYPINSTADDFSLVTDFGQRTGYFASARHGNDDLFSFQLLAQNQVLALGIVKNTMGELVDGYQARVINKTTGAQTETQTSKGSMTFLGERGQTYDVTVEHEKYETALQEVKIPLTGPETEKFTIILKEKAEGIDSKLLVVDTDQGTSKMYITSGDAVNEITEKDSQLYLQTPQGDAYLGKGNLSDVRTNPSSVLKELGLQKSERTNLRNIYFEFDKANLDAADKVYLDELTKILEHDPSLKLLVAGHADDRGEDDYNIRLSRRRVQAVTKYLMGNGIEKDRLIQKAYGESLPVVPCYAVDCSEEDHQKNRRAEFVLKNDSVHASSPRFSTSESATGSKQ